LAEKYASADLAHVLKVEEAFGKARQKPDKSISSWVSHMKSLANQLRDMGEDIEQNRVARRILNGVRKEYRSTKASLRASRRLKVDMVSQQLEAAELEVAEEAEGGRSDTNTKIPTPSITNQYNVNPRQMNPGSMHGPTAVAMPIVDGDLQTRSQYDTHQCSQQCHPSPGNLHCICSTYNTLPPPPGPPPGPYRQSYASGSARPHPYSRTPPQCNACKQLGHVEASC